MVMKIPNLNCCEDKLPTVVATGTFQGKPSKTFNRARAAIASDVINFLTNLQTKLLIHIPIQIDQGTYTLLNLHKGEAKTTTHHRESPGITTNHHKRKKSQRKTQ